MSTWEEILQCSEDFDENAWLNEIYGKIGAIPNSQPKKSDDKTSGALNGEIKSKKCDSVTKKCDVVPQKGDAKKKKRRSNKALENTPNHHNWLGYIIAAFINETVNQSMECCPGCKDSKNSPLFHSHYHSGLLEKLYMFAPSVRAMLVSKLPVLVADYVTKFPDPEIYDAAGQKVLTSIGRTIIRQCTPTFVYYTSYLTPPIDMIAISLPSLKSQPMTLKRVTDIVGKSDERNSKKSKSK